MELFNLLSQRLCPVGSLLTLAVAHQAHYHRAFSPFAEKGFGKMPYERARQCPVPTAALILAGRSLWGAGSRAGEGWGWMERLSITARDPLSQGNINACLTRGFCFVVFRFVVFLEELLFEKVSFQKTEARLRRSLSPSTTKPYIFLPSLLSSSVS